MTYPSLRDRRLGRSAAPTDQLDDVETGRRTQQFADVPG